MMSTTAVLLVAVWAGGAFSGLVAAASRYRYEVLRDEMKLEAIESKPNTRSQVMAKYFSMRRKREDRLHSAIAVSVCWPIAIPAVAAGYSLWWLTKLAQKPGEYMARKHGLVAIETEVKDCND